MDDGGDESCAARVISAEVQLLISALKMHPRWSALFDDLSDATTPPSESDLSIVSSLRKLLEVIDARDLRNCVRPFLSVIKSETCSGFITSTSLYSVSKFLRLLATPGTRDLSLLVTEISRALSNCKFEATEPESDQAVLAQLLRTVLQCSEGAVGDAMSDAGVVELFECCLRVALPARPRMMGHLLRSVAADTVSALAQNLFGRFFAGGRRGIAPAGVVARESLAADVPYGASSLFLILQYVSHMLGCGCSSTTVASAVTPAVTPTAESAMAGSSTSPPLSGATPGQVLESSESSSPSQTLTTRGASASLQPRLQALSPAAAPQLLVVAGLPLQDTPKRKAESQRLAISLAYDITDVCGASLESLPGAVALVERELCGSLLQLIQQPQSPQQLCLILRVLLNLFRAFPGQLKLHRESFLIACFKLCLESQQPPAPSSGPQVGGQPRQPNPKLCEVILHMLIEIANDDSFTAELYANYDCDLYCTNLLGALSEFLYKAAFPKSDSPLTVANHLALRAILALLSSLSRSVSSGAVAPTSGSGSTGQQTPTLAQRLRRTKERKILLMQAAEKFNLSAKDGLDFCRSKGLVSPEPGDARSVAMFLRTAPGLNKASVGEFIQNRKIEFNTAVLHEFAKTFVGDPQRQDAGQPRPLIDAIREFMQSFLIVGESPVIMRVIEALCHEYYEMLQNCPTASTVQGYPCTFASEDALTTLALSVIMLNVDLHNANVKERMTVEDYIKNLRQVNNKQDFPREMLVEYYHNISSRELRVPEELPTGTITANACADIVARAPKCFPYVTQKQLAGSSGLAALDLYRDAFATLWNPLIATLSITFETAADTSTLELALGGFSSCGEIATFYRLSQVVDYLVMYLCKASSLLVPSVSDDSSGLLAFAADTKARMAATSAFRLAKKRADLLREAWSSVFAVAASLHSLGLLPDIPEMPDFVVPPVAPSTSTSSETTPAASPKNRRGAAAAATAAMTILGSSGSSSSLPGTSPKPQGWLSALWWGSDSASEEQQRVQSQEVMQARAVAKICADECDVFGVIECTKWVDVPCLQAAMSALSRCSLESGDEEASVFCLDLIAKVVLLNSARLATIWPAAVEHHSRVLAAAASTGKSTSQTERSAADMLLLCVHLSSHPEVQRDIANCLWTLAGLPASVMADISDSVALGLLEMLRTPEVRDTVCRAGALPAIFALVRAVSGTPEGFLRGFEALACVVSSAQMNADEHVLCVDAVHHYLRTALASAAATSSPPTNHGRRPRTAGHGGDGSLLGHGLKRQNTAAVRSVCLLHELFFRASSWELCFKPLSVLAELSRSKSPDLRHVALSELQRAVLSSHLTELPPPLAPGSAAASDATPESFMAGWALETAVRRILFPLMADLLRPLGGSRDDGNETRFRSCSLLVKVVLQHLKTLVRSSDFVALWSEVIGYIEQYMIFATAKSTSSELISETLPELTKNMLLVMTTSGVFDPSTSDGSAIWELTCRALDRFLPSIKEEVASALAPPPQHLPPSATAVPAVPPAPAAAVMK